MFKQNPLAGHSNSQKNFQKDMDQNDFHDQYVDFKKLENISKLIKKCKSFSNKDQKIE